MRNEASNRFQLFRNRLSASAAIAILASAVSAPAADILLESFELGGFDEPGAGDVTTTPFQTTGVTNGSFSLKIDSTNTTWWTDFGHVVGYENHSGSTTLGAGQQPFGTVRSGFGNNGSDQTEGARTLNVFGSYLHGPILPANPAFADALIAMAADRATGRPFEPAELDDAVADEARTRQVRRLVR